MTIKCRGEARQILYNLSRLGALRSLQVVGWVGPNGTQRDPDNAIVMGVFSTITSPVFSELVVVLPHWRISLPHKDMFFQTLRKMYEVRPFELVFLFEGPCSVVREGHWKSVEARFPLKEAVDDVNSKGFLDFLDSPPVIRTVPRSHYYSWTFSDFD